MFFNLLACLSALYSCPSQDWSQVEGSEGQEGRAEGSAQPQEEKGQDQPYFPQAQDSAPEEAAQVPQEERTTQEQVSLPTEKGSNNSLLPYQKLKCPKSVELAIFFINMLVTKILGS